MSADVVSRAYRIGRERCREEARRRLATSGPFFLGFDLARLLNPFDDSEYHAAWLRGFDDERAWILRRVGAAFAEDLVPWTPERRSAS